MITVLNLYLQGRYETKYYDTILHSILTLQKLQENDTLTRIFQ